MIITISGANFSASNIGTLSTWTVSKSIGAGAEHSIPSYVDKNSAFNYTITLKDGYTFGTYSVTMGGETITPTVTETSMTINIASVTGSIKIEVKTINSSTGEPEEPGTGGGTEKTYGTLISNPSNLRGGVVDAIAVRPPFYEDIIGKKITKVNVYKVVDSSDSSKTNIQMGKIKLSSFDGSKITVSTFNNAVSNIESVQSYNVSSMGDVLDLTCDITLNDGEYLCFVVKNGHCVGYCNNKPDRLSMMYVYQNKIAPGVGSELSQQVPITVTVLNN